MLALAAARPLEELDRRRRRLPVGRPAGARRSGRGSARRRARGPRAARGPAGAPGSRRRPAGRARTARSRGPSGAGRASATAPNQTTGRASDRRSSAGAYHRPRRPGRPARLTERLFCPMIFEVNARAASQVRASETSAPATRQATYIPPLRLRATCEPGGPAGRRRNDRPCDAREARRNACFPDP